MADVLLQGPSSASPDDEGVPPAGRSFTGGAATWSAQHSLGGVGGAADVLIISPPARAIRCGGAGNLHISYTAKTAAGADWEDTRPALAGDIIQGQIDKVFCDASSTVTAITIEW